MWLNATLDWLAQETEQPTNTAGGSRSIPSVLTASGPLRESARISNDPGRFRVPGGVLCCSPAATELHPTPRIVVGAPG